MRNFFIISAVLSVLTACDRITPGIDDPEISGSTTPETPEPIFVTDTTIFLSGLEYPDGYDWRRDTAYGKVNAAIVLFKGNERILTINTGGSSGIISSEDRHHLIKDHIYTEALVGDKTSIGCDGHELFAYKGREMLRGLLMLDKDIYTLGQSLDGKGFSYRKNGKVLMARDDSIILGQMSSNPFYSSGALYLDGDRICFCYGTEQEDGTYVWSKVTDGMVKELKPTWPPSELFDIRIIDGEVFWLRCMPVSRECILINGANETLIGAKGSAAKLCALGADMDGNIAVSGQFKKDRQWETGFWTPATGFRVMFGESYHYLMDGKWGHVSYLPDGSLNMNCPGSSSLRIPGEGFFYSSFRNAAPAGDKLVIALNPVKPEQSPGFWLDGKWTEVVLHGFLTGVHAELTTRKED